MDLFYKNLEKVPVHFLAYRILGWIPETIQISDIGSPQSAFDKLKDNLNSGHLLLFYED